MAETNDYFKLLSNNVLITFLINDLVGKICQKIVKIPSQCFSCPTSSKCVFCLSRSPASQRRRDIVIEKLKPVHFWNFCLKIYAGD